MCVAALNLSLLNLGLCWREKGQNDYHMGNIIAGLQLNKDDIVLTKWSPIISVFFNRCDVSDSKTPVDFRHHKCEHNFLIFCTVYLCIFSVFVDTFPIVAAWMGTIYGN